MFADDPFTVHVPNESGHRKEAGQSAHNEHPKENRAVGHVRTVSSEGKKPLFRTEIVH